MKSVGWMLLAGAPLCFPVFRAGGQPTPAATLIRVTQNAPATFPTANTVSYRADIVQMDPAFLNGASPVVPVK